MALPTDPTVYDITGGPQAPSYAGGYYGETTASYSGGGYDPNNPNGYVDGANSIGGAAAVSDPTAYAPSFAGGYYGEQTGATGGGYDPATGMMQSDSANSIGGAAAITQDYTGAPSFAGGYYGDQIEESGGGYDPSATGTVYDVEDPAISRRAAAGLFPGGSSAGTTNAGSNVQFLSSGAGGSNAGSGPGGDWRVRVSLASRSSIFYKDGSNQLLAPLRNTDGVIFPYVPQLSITHAASYSAITPTHSNYPQPFYNNSEVQDIQITGDFTVQNEEEGRYLLAVIYFFRSATKMWFGSGDLAGNPPPILFLDGYGSHYLPHVPCVLTSFNHAMGSDVDYLEIGATSTKFTDVPVNQTANGAVADTANYGSVNYLDNQGMDYIPSMLSSAPTGPSKQNTTSSPIASPIKSYTRLPTLSSITINLKPIYSRKNMHDRFNLDRFAAGGLLSDPKAGYGGFI